jgi:hypothetical protein
MPPMEESFIVGENGEKLKHTEKKESWTKFKMMFMVHTPIIFYSTFEIYFLNEMRGERR